MDDSQRRARLEALFAAHAATVLAYARRRADPATADDVLSEVFVIAWRRLEQVPPEPVPWLLACARHVLAHVYRSKHRRAALIERLAAAMPQSEVPVELSDGVLRRALASLSESDREVLLLLAWEGLSSRQAATVLDCSPRTFSMRLHRARRRLSAALEVVEEPEPQALLETCDG
ncbi:MAG: RNA polymerase sigma factor [Solirubrobacteraceae bacterium]